MVFFQIRLGKILIWQKFSGTRESDFINIRSEFWRRPLHFYEHGDSLFLRSYEQGIK